MAKELEKVYDPKATEQQIYHFWEENGCFEAEVDAKKKALYHCNAAAQRHRTTAYGPRF